MKVEVQKFDRLSDVYRDALLKLQRLGPVSRDPEDVRAWRRVYRGIQQRLRRLELKIGHNVAAGNVLPGPELNGLPPGDNPSDNRLTSGEENA
jgi:hypothetical protein